MYRTSECRSGEVLKSPAGTLGTLALEAPSHSVKYLTLCGEVRSRGAWRIPAKRSEVITDALYQSSHQLSTTEWPRSKPCGAENHPAQPCPVSWPQILWNYNKNSPYFKPLLFRIHSLLWSLLTKIFGIGLLKSQTRQIMMQNFLKTQGKEMQVKDFLSIMPFCKHQRPQKKLSKAQ